MARVLVVEDEVDIRYTIKSVLSMEGYEVDEAGSIEEMYNHLKTDRFDVIVLDLLLPDGDAVDEIPRLRLSEPDSYILVLTAKRSDRDRILGLEMGADDYMVKPFNPREVVARVRALLRRKKQDYEEVLNLGRISINRTRMSVEKEGRLIPLSHKEFSILLLLASTPNKIFSRSEILDAVWGYEDVSDRVVDVYISYLRKKLGSDVILTVRGVGYRIKVD
ncbi:MAG: two-component system, OmpR family, response regulator [Thermotogota bacterium]|nr:two-component system, OmpR family, response regulator [Thermotogota bacterium]MDK2864769.1 two-component system, OmpR family, response regulator [Thermotogota bacterium]HCZ07146.1 DNA-binding response regulator [Thermotogota bacterium]